LLLRENPIVLHTLYLQKNIEKRIPLWQNSRADNTLQRFQKLGTNWMKGTINSMNNAIKKHWMNLKKLYSITITRNWQSIKNINQKKKLDKPVKPATGFFRYLHEVRDSIQKENKDWATSDISKEAGRQWNEMSDSQ